MAIIRMDRYMSLIEKDGARVWAFIVNELA